MSLPVAEHLASLLDGFPPPFTDKGRRELPRALDRGATHLAQLVRVTREVHKCAGKCTNVLRGYDHAVDPVAHDVKGALLAAYAVGIPLWLGGGAELLPHAIAGLLAWGLARYLPSGRGSEPAEEGESREEPTSTLGLRD